MTRILIIEDEPALLKVVAETLRTENFEVATATDAEKGQALLPRFKPDLILLDLILPGKNGFEFLKEIKGSAEFSKIPVIILTNLGDEEEIRQGLNLGAVDYLIKADYDLEDVVNLVRKYTVSGD